MNNMLALMSKGGTVKVYGEGFPWDGIIQCSNHGA